jgi:hypothetical protein
MNAIDVAICTYRAPTPTDLAAALRRISSGLAAAAAHLSLENAGSLVRLDEFAERVDDLARAVRRVRAELKRVKKDAETPGAI